MPVKKMEKDEILQRLVFSEAVVDAYVKAESTGTEPTGDHWSRPVLLERAGYLRKLARFSEGSASETIREYPGYSLALMVLLRSGDAVVHDQDGVMLTVLEGLATLVAGGAVERATSIGPGEIRGTAISGGSLREVQVGDMVHLAAGTPYQLLLSGEKTISCMVVRVTEIGSAATTAPPRNPART
jgi:hypothetical protein